MPIVCPLIITRRRVPRARRVIRRMQQLHILLRQLEIVNVRILLNARVRHRLWQRHESLLRKRKKKEKNQLTDSTSSSWKRKKKEEKPHLLQTPPNQHLRRRLPIPPRQNPQRLLPEPLAPHERTVSLHNDAPLLTPLHNLRPGQPRVHLPLPDADLPALALAVPCLEVPDVRFQLVEVVEAVVGDADGADEAGALGLDEGEPGAVAGGGAAVGGVD